MFSRVRVKLAPVITSNHQTCSSAAVAPKASPCPQPARAPHHQHLVQCGGCLPACAAVERRQLERYLPARMQMMTRGEWRPNEESDVCSLESNCFPGQHVHSEGDAWARGDTFDINQEFVKQRKFEGAHFVGGIRHSHHERNLVKLPGALHNKRPYVARIYLIRVPSEGGPHLPVRGKDQGF